MYLIGIELFTLASALCGLASDLVQLIAVRATRHGEGDAGSQQHCHSRQSGWSWEAGTRNRKADLAVERGKTVSE